MEELKVTNYNRNGEIIDISKVVLSPELSRKIVEILNAKKED